MDEKKIILLFVLAYIVIFAAYYPPFVHFTDEHQYLRNAYLLREGSLTISDPLYSYSYLETPQGFVSIYPIGQSLWILPFTLPGWQFSFLSGLVMHLLGLFIFIRILGRLQYPKIFSLLYLLFPMFIFLSRTLSSEMLSVVAVMAGFYFYLGEGKKNSMLAGAFFGISLLARYTNGLVLVALTPLLLIKDRKKWLHIVAGALPFAIAAMFLNLYLYGGFLTTGYSYSLAGMEIFKLGHLLFFPLVFIGLLSVIYPLMFFAQFFSKNKLRNESILVSVAFILFFGAYFFSNIRFRPEDLIVGIDKLAPVIPLLLLCYIDVLKTHTGKIKKFLTTSLKMPESISLKKAFIVFGIIMLIPVIVVSAAQFEKQASRYSNFAEIYSNTTAGSLILLDEDIPLYKNHKESTAAGMFFMEPFGDRKLAPMKQPYEHFITDVSSTYYMHIEITAGGYEVEIIPWEEYLQGLK